MHRAGWNRIWRWSFSGASHNLGVIKLTAAAGSLSLVSHSASAHAFGTPYNLPVPFWLYAYGAGAALLLSFLITAYFARIPVSAHTDTIESVRPPTRVALSTGWVLMLRVCSCAMLLLSIVAGLIGTQDPDFNINMTLFWIVFALAFYFISALIGDFYRIVNPWRSLISCVEIVAPRAFISRLQLPSRLRYWPALILYIAYIWIELFGATQPYSLAVILITYTAINLGAAALIGKEAWFRYGEIFSVLFHLAGMLAPIEYILENNDRTVYLRFRKPLAALFTGRVENSGLLLFIVFALSSTAFDGFHETRPWVAIFWRDIYPELQAVLAQPYAKLVPYYYYWQWAALVASPIFYAALYILCVSLAKKLTANSMSLRSASLSFGYSLMPIAVAYSAAHYFSLVVSQGAELLRLASDPFGFGWDLLGAAHPLNGPVFLNAGTVWHTQVALILLGHILGVYIAHVQALRLFGSARRALLSQLPMLLLMVIFTTLGLWILSLPIAAGNVIQPGSFG